MDIGFNASSAVFKVVHLAALNSPVTVITPSLTLALVPGYSLISMSTLDLICVSVDVDNAVVSAGGGSTGATGAMVILFTTLTTPSVDLVSVSAEVLSESSGTEPDKVTTPSLVSAITPGIGPIFSATAA